MKARVHPLLQRGDGYFYGKLDGADFEEATVFVSHARGYNRGHSDRLVEEYIGIPSLLNFRGPVLVISVDDRAFRSVTPLAFDESDWETTLDRHKALDPLRVSFIRMPVRHEDIDNDNFESFRERKRPTLNAVTEWIVQHRGRRSNIERRKEFERFAVIARYNPEVQRMPGAEEALRNIFRAFYQENYPVKATREKPNVKRPAEGDPEGQPKEKRPRPTDDEVAAALRLTGGNVEEAIELLEGSGSAWKV
jgi:hypothetical protein